jgi:hypothetical protein
MLFIRDIYKKKEFQMDFLEDIFERKHNRHNHGQHPDNHKKNDDDHHRPNRDYKDHDHKHYQQDELQQQKSGYEYYDKHHSDDNRYRSNDHHGLEYLRPIIEKILHNKPLLVSLSLIAAVLIIVCIALLFFLLPIIGQTFGYVDKNGIKGVIDIIMPVLDKLWKGQG